jgi:uncharacterized protein with GYD domain
MPKYMLIGNYTAEGAKGLLKDGGTKRREAAIAAVGSVGGTLESFYFGFGKDDFYAVVDAPDQASMAAAALTIGASGRVQSRTIVLLTPEELDRASQISVEYSPPGG